MDIDTVFKKIEASGLSKLTGGDDSYTAAFKFLVSLWPDMLVDLVDEPITVANFMRVMVRMRLVMDSLFAAILIKMGVDLEMARLTLSQAIQRTDQHVPEILADDRIFPIPEMVRFLCLTGDDGPLPMSEMIGCLCLTGDDAEGFQKAKTIGEMIEAYPLVYFRMMGYC